MTIVEYFISGCWWLLMVIILVAIGEYSIGGYCGCFINSYWWLFHCKPLVVILLVVIDGY